MAKRMDGKAVAEQLQQQIKMEVEKLERQGITPGLAVVIVGDDPASRTYVNNKRKACEKVGIYSEEYALPATTTQQELLDLIEKLNHKNDIDGILVQSPLPEGLNEKAVVEAINPSKDVDAFHAQNVGKILIGNYDFLPCTPAGVIELQKNEKSAVSFPQKTISIDKFPLCPSTEGKLQARSITSNPGPECTFSAGHTAPRPSPGR